jgi:hypothetical protein
MVAHGAEAKARPAGKKPLGFETGQRRPAMIVEEAVDVLTSSKVIESVTAALVTQSARSLGRRVAIGAGKARHKDRLADIQTASALNSYEVLQSISTQLASACEDQPDEVTGPLIEFLGGTEARSIVHELLAALLVGCEPGRLNRLDALFIRQLRAAYGTPTLDDSTEKWIAASSEQLFDSLCDACSDVAESVSNAQPETVDRIRQHAGFALIADTLDAIDRHLDAFLNADVVEVERDAEYEKTYRTQVHRMHGTITPPDFDRRRNVPLEDLYVSPGIHSQQSLSASAHSQPISLNELWESTDRTVLLGEPGGGKSTATGALLYQLSVPAGQFVPYLVVLRDYAQYRAKMSLVEYVEQRLKTHYQSPAPKGFVERTLLSGRGAVFFDGLDELLETSARRDITDAVEAFASRYPLARIFVTSRLVGYKQAPMRTDMFREYVLSNFSDNDVADYVRRWFALDEETTDDQAALLTDSFLRESQVVDDLRRNPLMLALMCIIYRGQHFIPKNRPAVYERCATLLFETWDGSRSIKAGIAAEDYLDEALKHLALWMLISDSAAEGVTRDQLIDETTAYFHGRAFEDNVRAKKAAAEFVDFTKGRAWVFSDAGTTAEGVELFKFTHRTFMEYFAAYELTRLAESPEKLARDLLPHISKQEWDMVGQLAVQIENKQAKDGSERVLRLMLDDKRRRTKEHRSNVLSFICRCLAFVNLPPALTRQIASEVWGHALDEGMNYFGSMQALTMGIAEDSVDYSIDEFDSVVRAAIASSDAERRRDGVGLALSLDFLVPFIKKDVEARPTRWRDARDEILNMFPDAVTDAISNSAGLRLIAARAGFCDAETFMRLGATKPGGRVLDPLFLEGDFRPLRIRLGPVAFEIIGSADNSSNKGHMAKFATDMRQIVDRLTADPSSVPWVSTYPGAYFGLLDLASQPLSGLDTESKPQSDISESAWRAVLILNCVVIESAQKFNASYRRGDQRPDSDSEHVGLLARARLGSEDARKHIATNEAIPAEVQAWASGKIDFVANTTRRRP